MSAQVELREKTLAEVHRARGNQGRLQALADYWNSLPGDAVTVAELVRKAEELYGTGVTPRRRT